MGWPTPQEYSEAIQNPSYAFRDPELQTGAAELDKLGLPRPIAGGFAVVYRVQTRANSTYAIRCFLTQVRESQERYRHIDSAIHQSRLPYFAGFSYMREGIRISGHWYPAMKMEWIEGLSISDYIERNLGNASALEQMAEQWLVMTSCLRTAGIAHGDLQHGNVLISPFSAVCPPKGRI